MRSRLEKILRTYFLSEEFNNILNQDKFKTLNRIKLICKDDEGNLLGIITDDRMIKYEYIFDDIKTTTYELKTYVEYAKDYTIESVYNKDHKRNNEWITELVEQWNSECNVELIADYFIFDKVLNELRLHKRYITGNYC